MLLEVKVKEPCLATPYNSKDSQRREKWVWTTWPESLHSCAPTTGFQPAIFDHLSDTLLLHRNATHRKIKKIIRVVLNADITKL